MPNARPALALAVAMLGLAACGSPAAARAPATTFRTTTSAQATTTSASTTPPSTTTTSTTTTSTTLASTTTTTPATTVAPTTTVVATSTTTGSEVGGIAAPAGVTSLDAIPSDHLIRPTAIILHWWGAVAGSDVDVLVESLLGQTGYYEPWLTKAEYLSNEARGVDGHHLGVQFAVTRDGRIWMLTPYANSYAAHAACANSWAVGIEIEGRGAADLHDDPVQFASVVKLVGELMRLFDIPIDGPIAANGLSGIGVHSHKQVDLHCYFADGSFAGTGKIDVDDAYLAEVHAALAREGLH